MDLDEARAFLREHHRAVLATFRADGRPQMSPVAAGVAGAAFLALLHLLGADGPGGLRALVQNARFDSSAVEPGSRAPQTATPSER